MAGSSWPALTAGTKARASDVEAKFDWIEGSIVPMSGGNMTDAAYDLGTSSARWRDSYLSRTGYFGTSLIIGATTSTFGVFRARVGADLSLHIGGNLSYTSTAVGITTLNDAETLNLPLEIRALGVRISLGNLSLPDTTTAVSEFSTDGTMAGNSDVAVPTEKAVKAYVDGKTNADFVRAYLSANQSMTAASFLQETVKLNAVSVDPNGRFSTAAYAFYAPTNGTYNVVGDVYMSYGGVSPASPEIYILKNGAIVMRSVNPYAGYAGSGVFMWLHASILLSLTSGDTIQLAADVVTTTTFFLGGTTRANQLAISRIS